MARGTPGFIRSDNGPEFVALAVKGWIGDVGAKTAYIEPGSPWENGYVESFNGKLRDELLNMEVFNTLLEARVLTEQWRTHYNAVRPLLPGLPAACAGGPATEQADAARLSRANRLTATVSYNAALTFRPDHSVGADQFFMSNVRCFFQQADQSHIFGSLKFNYLLMADCQSHHAQLRCLHELT